MRSFGVQGETRKIPPAAFVSFGVQKKIYSLLRPKGRISCLSARKTKLCLCFFQDVGKKPYPLCTQKEGSIPPRGDADTPWHDSNAAIFKHFLTKLPTHLYFDLHFCKVFWKFSKNFLIFLQKTLDTVFARWYYATVIKSYGTPVTYNSS